MNWPAVIVIIFTIAAPVAASAEESAFFRLDWCDDPDPDRRRDGWHFYCDDPPPEEDAPEEEVRQQLPPPAPATVDTEPVGEPTTAVERLAAITRQIEELRAAAILAPEDAEKVEAYMRAQAAAVERASVFSDTWRRSVWANPDLDYTRRRPTNGVAGPLFHETRNAAEIDALKTVAKERGLFFVFEGAKTCVTCAAQAAILENIAATYGIAVLGISRDGATLPQFPDPLRSAAKLKALGLDDKPVPALVLVSPETSEVQPIAFAAIAEDQILERIFVVTQSRPGELY